MQVVALIREENGVYRALFPDFPGCTPVADNPNSIIAKATEALSHHIARMIADGRELPQVRSLAWFAADPTFLADSGSLMIVLVSYTPAPREVRVHRSNRQNYSITSSARMSSVGGTMMPSAFKANFAYIEQRLAYEKLKKGEIDAMIAVQGKPSKFTTTIKDPGLHLVPVD